MIVLVRILVVVFSVMTLTFVLVVVYFIAVVVCLNEVDRIDPISENDDLRRVRARVPDEFLEPRGLKPESHGEHQVGIGDSPDGTGAGLVRVRVAASRQ